MSCVFVLTNYKIDIHVDAIKEICFKNKYMYRIQFYPTLSYSIVFYSIPMKLKVIKNNENT